MAPSRKLPDLIRDNREELLAYWRKRVRQLPSAKGLDRPTLHDHIPIFLDELAYAFESQAEGAVIHGQMEIGSPPSHGVQRFEHGFNLEEVVAEYNILRDCIHNLADKNSISLQGQPFHILNSALDAAIAAAAKAYTAQQALDIQRRREDYLAFVAHDLRTPLSAIALAAQALEKTVIGQTDPVVAKKMLAALQRNVGYLTTLVAKILEENANLETESGIRLERRYFDLWPVVESLIHDLRPIAGKGTTRLVNQVPEDLMVYADAALVRRIFQNLIANAISHAPAGEVIIGAKRLDHQVECHVSDNGRGIAPERLPHIFEKYETDNISQKNLGLGLTICKAFVEAHGGRILVESQLNRGSTFYFTLPEPSDAA